MDSVMATVHDFVAELDRRRVIRRDWNLSRGNDPDMREVAFDHALQPMFAKVRDIARRISEPLLVERLTGVDDVARDQACEDLLGRLRAVIHENSG